MVTAGANQAFVNVVLTLLDASDKVVLFVPYYFNHLMAIQVSHTPCTRHPGDSPLRRYAGKVVHPYAARPRYKLS